MPTATCVIADLRTALTKKKEPKEPKPVKEKKAAPVKIHDFCDPSLTLKRGMPIEVRQRDGTGFDGAWFNATILAINPNGSLHVLYDRNADEMEMPPPPPPPFPPPPPPPAEGEAEPKEPPKKKSKSKKPAAKKPSARKKR